MSLARTAILASGVMLIALNAGAQYRDRYPGGPYSRGPRGDDAVYGRSVNVIDRVIARLESSRSYRYLDGHERRHFEQARRDLDRFRVNWARGKFDKDRLDGAIEHIDHLVDSDQLHPRERQMLARDIDALRDFRASRGYDGWRRYPR